MNDSNAALPVSPARRATRIDPRLLEILVCPVTRATLEYDSSDKSSFRGGQARLSHSDGIPIMLPEERARSKTDRSGSLAAAQRIDRSLCKFLEAAPSRLARQP